MNMFYFYWYQIWLEYAYRPSVLWVGWIDGQALIDLNHTALGYPDRLPQPVELRAKP